MAVNPMQRKARNSFLLGMIATLLITGAIIVLLFLQLKKLNDEKAQEAALLVNVYTLTQDIKSGQVLTQDMFTPQTVSRTTVPANATSVASVIDTWFLQTKDGEAVCRDKDGLYLNTPDSIIEVYSENGGYYRLENGEKVNVSMRNDPFVDDEGYFSVDTSNEDKVTRVYEEISTGNFYVYKLNAANNNRTRDKVYLEINNVPVLAKVDMKQNTVVTPDLIVQSDEVVTDDMRKEEYNMIELPVDLTTGDYIDIRLMTPSGQNFIVISKVEVEIPQNADGSYIADTVWVKLREDEILSLSSAIVEAYGISGGKLYANKYAEPGLQAASAPTYTPNAETTALIQSNPNIVELAREELASRYSQAAVNLRNQYLQTLINEDETYKTNVQTEMDADVTEGRSTRQRYLQSIQEASGVY